MELDQAHVALGHLEDLRRNADPGDGFTLTDAQLDAKARALADAGVMRQAVSVGGVSIIVSLIDLVKQILASRRASAEASAEKAKAGPTFSGQAGQPPSPPPTAAQVDLESWYEEGWHDWAKGSLPGEPDSDWMPSGSPKFNAILSGKEALPPGATLRMMTGEHVVGGPAVVPGTGRGALTHHFVVSGDQGEKEFTLRSDYDNEAGGQPIPEFAHVQFGPRWRKGGGWDVMARLNSSLGPGKLTYFATHDGYTQSASVSIRLAGK